MKTILYEKDGAPLKVKFKVKNGVLAAAYWIKLSDGDSSAAVVKFEGDTQNTADDDYDLPPSLEENNGRILRLSTDFYGLDPELSKEYFISLDVYQGEKFLDFLGGAGELTSSTQVLLDFGKLKMI